MALHPMTAAVQAALGRQGRWMTLPDKHVSDILDAADVFTAAGAASNRPRYVEQTSHDAQEIDAPRPPPPIVAPRPAPVDSRLFWRTAGSNGWHGPFFNADDANVDAFTSGARGAIEIESLPAETKAIPPT